MSRFHRDNGTFASGLFTGLVIVASFILGYALRHEGFILQIKHPQEVRR
jgi:hypothetical protein